LNKKNRNMIKESKRSAVVVVLVRLLAHIFLALNLVLIFDQNRLFANGESLKYKKGDHVNRFFIIRIKLDWDKQD
jgi:hypothetical protein